MVTRLIIRQSRGKRILYHQLPKLHQSTHTQMAQWMRTPAMKTGGPEFKTQIFIKLGMALCAWNLGIGEQRKVDPRTSTASQHSQVQCETLPQGNNTESYRERHLTPSSSVQVSDCTHHACVDPPCT